VEGFCLARWLALLFLFGSFQAAALELQEFLTKKCERKAGLMVNAEGEDIAYIDLDGHLRHVHQAEIQSLYVFDVVDNPFPSITIDDEALFYLRALYLEDSSKPSAYVFPTRFIEDLLLFYSVDGKTHVQTYTDIFKIRQAPALPATPRISYFRKLVA
jgi:hypothetical protein